MTLRNVGLVARAFVLVALALGVAVAIAVPLSDHVGGAALAGIASAVALVVAAGGALWLFGPPAVANRAVADGLLAYVEQDFSLRLAEDRAHDPAGLVRRFNKLGDALRARHNEGFQKELLLETVLRATPTAILLENEAGRIVYANDTARELLGDGGPLVGRLLADLVADTHEGLRDALASSGDVLFSVEIDGVRQVYDLARRRFHITTQQHQLTMIRPLGRELERRESEAWKRAIRVMSHELNNSLAPVSSLIHSARTLADRPDSADKLRRVFEAVEERTTHLREFLDGFARFARLPQPTPEEVAWPDFLTSVQALHPFTLVAEPPSTPGWFDPGQLQQVLINLVRNAVEAGGAADQIEVSVQAADGGATLEVRDRGRGMSEEVRGKALLPFYSTKKTGSGIGLSLCREIVDAHGGRIALHAREGGGTCVELWLPDRAA